jgi:multidrug efflux pump subunit AcrA (membrane-fusion protein)
MDQKLMSLAVELAEYTEVAEKLILAPARGVVTVLDPQVVTAEGEIVEVGQAVAIITNSGDEIDAVSRFNGFLMGMLVHTGERVRAGQPIAWLRTFA